jgi:hypothetical protein
MRSDIPDDAWTHAAQVHKLPPSLLRRHVRLIRVPTSAEPRYRPRKDSSPSASSASSAIVGTDSVLRRRTESTEIASEQELRCRGRVWSNRPKAQIVPVPHS